MKNLQRGEALLAMALLVAIISGGAALYGTFQNGVAAAGTYQAIPQGDGTVLVMDTRTKSVQTCRPVANRLDCEPQRTAATTTPTEGK